MLDGSCRTTRIVNCESGPAGIERLPQIDLLWESDTFDKFEWEDSFFRIRDAGMARVLGALRRSLGQIAKGDHVPVIWRRGSDVQNELGVSADGYWGPLGRAVEAGLVVKVDQHGLPGRRKILIAKMPAESEFHAVARAKGAVERYLQKNPAVPRWVLRSLRTELDNQVAAASVVTRQGRCSQNLAALTDESLMCRESTSGEQSSNLCTSEIPTYREQEIYEDSREEEAHATVEDAQRANEPSDAPSPPPKVEECEKEKTDDASEEPAEHEPLRAFLGALFAKCGLAPKVASLSIVAEAYGASVGDSEALRHELRAKIVRLADSGFRAAKVVGYLLEDCPTPQPTMSFEKTSSHEGERPDEEMLLEEPAVEWDEIEEVPDFVPIRKKMEELVSSHNYASWFAEGQLVCVELGDRVELIARDEFLKTWIEGNYVDLLEIAVEDVLKKELEVVIQTRGGYFMDATATKKAAYEARL